MPPWMCQPTASTPSLQSERALQPCPIPPPPPPRWMYPWLRPTLHTLPGSLDMLSALTCSAPCLGCRAGLRHVHFMSVDTEGSELSILKGINFRSVFFEIVMAS